LAIRAEVPMTVKHLAGAGAVWTGLDPGHFNDRFQPLQRGDKGNAQVIAEVRPRSADILARLYDAEKFLKKLVFDLEISPVIIPVALPRP
jgi:hypothetical protein